MLEKVCLEVIANKGTESVTSRLFITRILITSVCGRFKGVQVSLTEAFKEMHRIASARTSSICEYVSVITPIIQLRKTSLLD